MVQIKTYVNKDLRSVRSHPACREVRRAIINDRTIQLLSIAHILNLYEYL